MPLAGRSLNCTRIRRIQGGKVEPRRHDAKRIAGCRGRNRQGAMTPRKTDGVGAKVVGSSNRSASNGVTLQTVRSAPLPGNGLGCPGRRQVWGAGGEASPAVSEASGARCEVSESAWQAPELRSLQNKAFGLRERFCRSPNRRAGPYDPRKSGSKVAAGKVRANSGVLRTDSGAAVR